MLIDANRSVLLVIDLQVKLVPALSVPDEVVAQVEWLVQVAQKIGVPVAATEHHPRGLGSLVPQIRTLLPDDAVAAKENFSCVAAQCLPGLPGHDRAQIVISGAETHVCVLQTALDLIQDGREVFVVADAVGSRRAYDRDMALLRMREEGVRIITREMAAFEWLAQADATLFREVNRQFLR